MFDIGFWELLVLAVLGLLILGPERLPRVVGQLGRWLRQARRTASQLRWQIEHELDLSDRREAERKRREQTPKAPVDADGTGSGTASTPAATPRAGGLHGDDLHGGDLHHGGDLPGGTLPEAPPADPPPPPPPPAATAEAEDAPSEQDPAARP